MSTAQCFTSDLAVLSEIADQGVRFEKRQLLTNLLPGFVPLQNLAKRPKLVDLVARGEPAGSLEILRSMFSRERKESLEDSNALDPAFADHRFSPLRAFRPDQSGIREKRFDAPFGDRDLLGRYVTGLCAEATGINTSVDRNLMKIQIEDPDESAVVPHPDSMAEILRWDGVERILNGDVSIAMDFALLLNENGEPILSQGPESWLLDVMKELPDLLSRGPMDPLIGDLRFPLRQMVILFFETRKDPSFERVVLYVLDSTLDLTLVSWSPWLGRQDRDAVVLGE